MKYLYLAKQRGCRVVVVNPYLEPGLERYWVPSNLESALFGTKICDLHVPVRPGGDVALANAALKRLIQRGAVDEAFIAAHTTGWDDLVAGLDQQAEAERCSRRRGSPPTSSTPSSTCTREPPSAVLVWSMGITQHRDAVDGVRAIVNLGLARGNVGRDGAGLMPIRGHSGVQGGAEMGAYATALPGGAPVDPDHARALADAWGFPVPDAPGPHRARDGRRRGGGRDRRAVDLGRQLPRGPPRPAVGGCRARPGAAARAPGRGGHHADAGRRRRRAAPPGGHPLRAGGRRHRDHHGAADHLQPGDPSPGGGGPERVAAVRRRRLARAARAAPVRSAGRPTGTCGRRSPGSSPPTPASRRSPPPATRCSGAVGTSAPAATSPSPMVGPASRR